MNVVKAKQDFAEDAERILMNMRWEMRTKPYPGERANFERAVRRVQIASAMEHAAAEQRTARRRLRRPSTLRYRGTVLG